MLTRGQALCPELCGYTALNLGSRARDGPWSGFHGEGTACDLRAGANPHGLTQEPEFLTDTCSPQETFSAFSHPPPPGRLGRLKGEGGQRSRGEGAEPLPAIISWPWARRLQAEPVGRRGACCLRKGGSGVEGGPLLGTGSCLCPGLGFTGGRKGKARLGNTY